MIRLGLRDLEMLVLPNLTSRFDWFDNDKDGFNWFNHFAMEDMVDLPFMRSQTNSFVLGRQNW